MRRPYRPWTTLVLVALSLGFLALQAADPFVEELAVFTPSLVSAGEPWRIVTANFLHARSPLPLHLLVNLAALLLLSQPLERPLGSRATAVVAGVSALGAMAGSALAGYDAVVGLSGVVAGMAGGVLCLELHHADRLPAPWRFPRRFFIAVLVVEGLLGLVVPRIAGAAHIGGFVAGYAITRPLALAPLVGRGLPSWASRLAVGVGLAAALSCVALVPLLARQGWALDRHAQCLLVLEDGWTLRFNEVAWRMATEAAATPEQLASAVALAERAVEQTGRDDPDLLDTLAEVHFARGELEEALAVIGEAIRVSPDERYFREQQRRFLGERAATDRPEPPLLPWALRRPAPRLSHPDPGVEI